MKKYEIIAVDFDGTLCSDCYPDIGKPNLPLIELLKALKRGLPDHSLDLQVWQGIRAGSTVVRRVRTGI